jgi:hypothetical protein
MGPGRKGGMTIKYGTQEIRNRKKPNVSRGDADMQRMGQF